MKKRYIVKDGDVLEVRGELLINKTLPLRRQIKGFFLVAKKLLPIVIVALTIMLAGCTDTQKFGKGDPPDDYVAMFGNDNGARLNFIQNQDLAKIAEAVNKQAIALAELNERVKVLEPQDHSKCILDLDGKCCTTKGCKVLNPDEVVK